MKNEGGERGYGGDVVEVWMAWSVIVVVSSLYARRMSAGEVGAESRMWRCMKQS
jgi:hypothetical protein